MALRFLQGFAVGGEWGGATLMAVEYAPMQGGRALSLHGGIPLVLVSERHTYKERPLALS